VGEVHRVGRYRAPRGVVRSQSAPSPDQDGSALIVSDDGNMMGIIVRACISSAQRQRLSCLQVRCAALRGRVRKDLGPESQHCTRQTRCRQETFRP
jgi:hypothetical protein